MAQGLEPSSIVRAALPRPMESSVPFDAEEAAFEMEGREPVVQLVGGAASEMKTAPNYDDYLRWKEQQRQARREQLAASAFTVIDGE